MKKYLYLMRVHHYIKNILIFMPLIFSGNLTDRRKFTATLLGMIAFSLDHICGLYHQWISGMRKKTGCIRQRKIARSHPAQSHRFTQ